jgi:hypothetical protein
LIRKINGVNKSGIQRVWWDLQLQPYDVPKLRTQPKGKDWVKQDDKGERSMFIYDLDIGPGLNPPLAPPGMYMVVLKANGKEYKQSLQLLKDPNTKSSEDDIAKQYTLGIQLYNSIKTTLKLIDEMEHLRSQLIAKKSDKKSVQLEEKIYQLEASLHDVHQTGARMDIFRNPPQVLERLLALAGENHVNSADARPTDQQKEVFELTTTRLAEVQSQFELLRKNPEIKQVEGKTKR